MNNVYLTARQYQDASAQTIGGTRQVSLDSIQQIRTAGDGNGIASIEETAVQPGCLLFAGALLRPEKRQRDGEAMVFAPKARAAAPLLEKAASLNPDESAVFYHLSRALKALGRDAEARKASARVAELKRQGIERDQDAVILR